MGAQGQPTPGQINAIARSAIRARAITMEQQISAQTFNAGAGVNLASVTPIVNIVPRMVGLIRGFWVKVQLNIHNGSGVQINLTDFGAWNALQQIQFNDLNNNTRIQTPGWHLGMLQSMKMRKPFGSAMVNGTGFASGSQAGNTNFPVKMGDNWAAEIQAPATIAAAGDGTVIMWYWVPLAYSHDDLRGAIYANVVNATMQLQLSLPTTPVVANGTDSTNAMYVGNAAGAVALAVVSSATITVYQNYLDQLPVDQNRNVLLPILDLATIYGLTQTTITGVVANQDFPAQYANYRDFLSTLAVYVNTGASGARGVGLDVNSWMLQSANFTNIFKREPALQTLHTRNHLGVDPPPGMYYFGSREKPISTTQYGNMQLVLNPATAGAGAYLMLAYEYFALVQTLAQAGSLVAS